jgi:hypothetical protein
MRVVAAALVDSEQMPELLVVLLHLNLLSQFPSTHIQSPLAAEALQDHQDQIVPLTL